MLRKILTLLSLPAFVMSLALFAGCGDQAGNGETNDATTEEAADDAQGAMEEAADAAGEAADEAGDAAEDAADEASDAMSDY